MDNRKNNNKQKQFVFVKEKLINSNQFITTENYGCETNPKACYQPQFIHRQIGTDLYLGTAWEGVL